MTEPANTPRTRWHEICEERRDDLRGYDSFLSHDQYRAPQLLSPLALPFTQPVHMAGLDEILHDAPRAAPWETALRLVRNAHRAARNADHTQIISLDGTPALLYMAPIGGSMWARCSLQTFWNDDEDEPAYAIWGYGAQPSPDPPPPLDHQRAWQQQAAIITTAEKLRGRRA